MVYRLVVRSADEAVQTIRDRFGSAARVLSVKQQEGRGIAGLFSSPKLEVLVQTQPVDTSSSGESFVGAEATSSPAPSESPSVSASAISPSVSLPGSTSVEEQPRIVIRKSEATPVTPSMPDLLRRSGFSETLLSRLSCLPSWKRNDQEPLHVALVELGRDLRKLAAVRKPRPLPARSAFIGSRGAGATTALCKWLGAEVFSRGRGGRVLKVEFDQPNIAENLAIYSEALGLELEHYSPGIDLGIPEGNFLYADLPGFGFHRNSDNQVLARFLNTARFDGRVLVLNALNDSATLRAAYSVGVDLGATHLVFTHCDELLHWGKLMDFLVEAPLSPLFLATGPSLSGDCEEDPLGAALRKTIPGA
jgi:flagellar biosynthesis protein FlhF